MGDLLSIIISNKDHGEFLPRQLASIVSQTVSFDEVILIDDGSSDNSKEVMRDFKSNNPHLNVRLFLHKENAGAVKRYDEGLMDSTSKFVYFAASDDYLLPDFVSEYKKVINLADSRVKLIASHSIGAAAAGGFVTPEKFIGNRDRHGNVEWIPGHGAAIDRKTLIEFGGHNPKVEFHHDWFLLHAIAFTHGLFGIPRELSVFTHREDAYSRTIYSKDKTLEIRSEMIRVLMEEETYSHCKDIMIDRCNSRIGHYIARDLSDSDPDRCIGKYLKQHSKKENRYGQTMLEAMDLLVEKYQQCRMKGLTNPFGLVEASAYASRISYNIYRKSETFDLENLDRNTIKLIKEL